MEPQSPAICSNCFELLKTITMYIDPGFGLLEFVLLKFCYLYLFQKKPSPDKTKKIECLYLQIFQEIDRKTNKETIHTLIGYRICEN